MISVTVTGLTDAGFLFAVDRQGNTFELHPDGNSLDILTGMIGKKLS
jgi:biotin--protein ligase